MKVWLNGEICAQEDATVPVADRGFLLGDGFFETMRVHNGRVGLLPRHMARLNRHAKTLGVPGSILPDEKDVAGAITTLSRELTGPDGVARLTVSRGAGQRGLLPPEQPVPTVLLTIAEFAPADPQSGIMLATSKTVRRNPWSIAGRVKSLNYLDNIAARQEAARAGADDALILSVDGSVAETTIANLFAIRGKTLWTPGTETGILPGIAREVILEWAGRQGVACEMQTQMPEELLGMDVVFTCNALQGVRRVAVIDGRALAMPSGSGHLFAEIGRMADACLCKGLDV